jgi:hypothetical protein
MVNYHGINLLQNNAISDGVYIPSFDVLQNNVTSALMVVLKVPVTVQTGRAVCRAGVVQCCVGISSGWCCGGGMELGQAGGADASRVRVVVGGGRGRRVG